MKKGFIIAMRHVIGARQLDRLPEQAAPTDLPSASAPRCAPFLIDISRLIWRLWSGRMPTGIDRVCLAYLAHFGARADAVLQWKGRHIVFAGADARRMLALLTADLPRFRRRLVATLGRTLPNAIGTLPCRGQIYLNIGHTGLDDPALVAWIGRSGLRAVHLVHDLIPIEAPEFCRPGEAQRHARRMTNALSSASGVICNSQATLEALHRFATVNGLPDVPMVTAWLAADALPSDVVARTADRPYFVVVGTIEGRKNHWLLLQIWKRLVTRMGPDAPRLMLVGQRGWEAAGPLAMLDRCPALQDTVTELGRCSDTDLASLLKGAQALLMPSFVEGFGMPVVEALRLNTPVIAADLPVFREIAGSIPTYADPLDAITWERLILDFCGPSAERSRQCQAMQGYRAPDWASHFQTVEQWLAGIAESPARSLPG